MLCCAFLVDQGQSRQFRFARQNILVFLWSVTTIKESEIIYEFKICVACHYVHGILNFRKKMRLNYLYRQRWSWVLKVMFWKLVRIENRGYTQKADVFIIREEQLACVELFIIYVFSMQLKIPVLEIFILEYNLEMISMLHFVTSIIHCWIF